MPAYMIARVDVRDPVQYAEYAKQTPRCLAAFGARFIARSPAPTTLEGPPETHRIVIVEFPSVERAVEFYNSPEYTKIKALRADAADGSFFVVEGYGDDAWTAALAASQALPPL
jgi:uncharacterized protein (DUF1330 family)